MPQRRSRPNTEAKFKDAVLDLVAESGCGALGINAVAQKAGADKVLIYRYFGDLDGLLQSVADQQSWLPKIDDIVESIESNTRTAVEYLSNLFHRMVQHIRSKASTLQIVRWRKASRNPLTNHFSQEWNTLWSELPSRITQEMDEAARTAWQHACRMLSLLIEAELNDEAIDPSCIHVLATNLPPLKVDA